VTWQADGLFVKICGLGTPGDVSAAAEAGADAVGFVWWERSPRHRPLDEIRALVGRSRRPTVLVTVDLDSETLIAAAGRAGVDAVQPHGRNAAVAAAAARRVGLSVIRPVSAGGVPVDVAADDLLLVDTPDPDLPGGTGRPFDWSLAVEVGRPFLLAGGLGPDNVAEAVKQVRPFGVDASSGLESSPGVKDADLIRRFVEEAKQA
jgi:phosphoribosylanthranilate isomerase